MQIKALFRLVLLMIFSLSVSASAQQWITKSNKNSELLLQVLAQQSPEYYASTGVEGFNEAITDFTPGFEKKQIKALQQIRITLGKRRAAEQDSAVLQDLDILLAQVDNQLINIALEDKYFTAYINVSDYIYNGLRHLLDSRNTTEQHQAALTRINRYAGLEVGYQSSPKLVQDYMTLSLAEAGKLGPVKDKVEKDLQNGATLLAEIPSLFEQFNVTGYEPALQAITAQLKTYNQFIRNEVLPKARTDFRQPQEVYEQGLKDYGVDMPLEELQNRARTEFKQLQNAMQALAIQIAKQKNFPDSDYRAVLRALKTKQIEGDKILPFYEQKNAAIEAIIRRENILTLPERGLTIRLASKAEAAQSPAPFMSPPRLIGNTGEVGEFVLPLSYPGAKGGKALKIDDFTYEAAAWPLSAHEARPGHELQFAAMVEKGVSTARMLFAFNSVNVEGWALYAEEEIKPYLSLEGQFATNWSRLVRSARVFLDIGLNTGKINREQAEKVLRDDVVLSEALVNSEVERYMFRAPGQATSYFNGYSRLMEIRAETELLLGDKFNRKAFHDFILAQGLLPPKLLKQSVLSEFVPTT
jgi:uncharacterized protein (DUF885 family)